jgi:signal peptidase I
MVCVGFSMMPTLRPMDLLEVVSYNGSSIRPGDVVVFFAKGKRHKVAHRVVSVGHGNVITKGDNNSKVDTDPIPSKDIVGRVVYSIRGKKTLCVYGGSRGQLRGSIFSTKQLLDRALSSLLRPAYHRLARTGIALRITPLRKKIRTVVFKRPHGDDTQIFMGSLLIARHRSWNNRWFVRKPFRLFVEPYIAGTDDEYA